ncbi:MAG: hypothetical protein ING36_02470 [Burkholderiales bacterium]|jgi:hypothetical protein|nr:hypothetical protein [Burkholderiales bacterium]
MAKTKADTLLDDAYKALSLIGKSAALKYASITNIVAHLHAVNAKKKIAIATTGTISERLCELGLKQVKQSIPEFEYRRFGEDWRWTGDLLVPGHPYDLAISVKSYKAKERLLASGTGSLLTPTIGWGLFDDVDEWSPQRTKSYLYRGFIAIYMPENTLAKLQTESHKISNINGNAFLRNLTAFPIDIYNAIIKETNRVDFRKI